MVLRAGLTAICRARAARLTHLPLPAAAAAAAAALFQVIITRHRRGSIVLTTNRGVAAWGQTFGDPAVAAAMLDRLLHHATVLAIDGPSYRMRSHQVRVDALRAAARP